MQPTGTNRSKPPIPNNTARVQRPDPAARPPAPKKTRQRRDTSRPGHPITTATPGGLARPGGHSGGQNTRSHPELGRENPQRQWYCAARRGRVGRRQARQTRTPQTRKPTTPSPPRPSHHRRLHSRTNAGWSSPVARQAHNLKVEGSNPSPATTFASYINLLRGAPDVRIRCPLFISDGFPKNPCRRAFPICRRISR